MDDRTMNALAGGEPDPLGVKCVFCREPVEESDQPEGVELCNACAADLDAKFAPLAEVLCDPQFGKAIEEIYSNT